MSMNKEQREEFSLVGELIGFIWKDGYKLKYLRLQVQEQEYWIKVDKELRQQLGSSVGTGNIRLPPTQRQKLSDRGRKFWSVRNPAVGNEEAKKSVQRSPNL
jgi:hypothetical protein